MAKRLFVALVLCLVALSAVAQDGQFFEYASDHYRVRSQVSRIHAEETALKLEAMMRLYNEYFRFDPDRLTAKLNVRIFRQTADFDRYLRRVINETRDDFTYLHYSDLARSELVGFYSEGESFDLSLSHQGFVQFLRAFVANPPLWLREGFAVFFEQSEYDDDFQTVVYRENLSWLETLQSVLDGTSRMDPIPLREMLTMDVDEARRRIDVFYPQAWGVVSFLVNAPNRDINRILWDTISALEPRGTKEQNEENIEQKVLRWLNEDFILERFGEYVAERKSFRRLVEDGIDHYDRGQIVTAESVFVQALQLREDSFVPHYYLGLINYDKGNHSLAEYYYNQALARGADDALTYYALGVNAFADNRFDDAMRYLDETVEVDPAYSEKAAELIAEMEG